MTKKVIFGVMLLVAATFVTPAQDHSAQDLIGRVIERRAVEAVIWGLPAVNLDLMLQAMIFGPVLKMVGEFEASVKKNPLIAMGTPDPYTPQR